MAPTQKKGAIAAIRSTNGSQGGAFSSGISRGFFWRGYCSRNEPFFVTKKLIIVSSVKTKKELPKRLRLARQTGAYKLVPTSLAFSVKDLTKLAFGPRSKKKLRLYQEYLSVRDKTYLNWAIKQMVCWERENEVEGVIHIHGDADIVFPIKNIEGAIVLKGGTHIMILNKGSAVSKLLENSIEKE